MLKKNLSCKAELFSYLCDYRTSWLVLGCDTQTRLDALIIYAQPHTWYGVLIL